MYSTVTGTETSSESCTNTSAVPEVALESVVSSIESCGGWSTSVIVALVEVAFPGKRPRLGLLSTTVNVRPLAAAVSPRI